VNIAAHTLPGAIVVSPATIVIAKSSPVPRPPKMMQIWVIAVKIIIVIAIIVRLIGVYRDSIISCAIFIGCHNYGLIFHTSGNGYGHEN
jgi:hypothetical protein